MLDKELLTRFIAEHFQSQSKWMYLILGLSLWIIRISVVSSLILIGFNIKLSIILGLLALILYISCKLFMRYKFKKFIKDFRKQFEHNDN
jgi:hypothetical protein